MRTSIKSRQQSGGAWCRFWAAAVTLSKYGGGESLSSRARFPPVQFFSFFFGLPPTCLLLIRRRGKAEISASNVNNLRSSSALARRGASPSQRPGCTLEGQRAEKGENNGGGGGGTHVVCFATLLPSLFAFMSRQFRVSFFSLFCARANGSFFGVCCGCVCVAYDRCIGGSKSGKKKTLTN